MAGLKVGGSITMNDAPKDDGSTVGVNLTEFNGTYMANNIFARFEYGTISYTDNPDGYESSSGYYLDLGYDIGDLVGCGEEPNLYVWTRMSNYNRTDVDGDENEISLFGVTYKPINNITGATGDYFAIYNNLSSETGSAYDLSGHHVQINNIQIYENGVEQGLDQYYLGCNLARIKTGVACALSQRNVEIFKNN